MNLRRDTLMNDTILIKSNVMNRIAGFLQYFILFFSAYYILTYIIIALLRMNYPFDIEWMEGGMVEHVYRLLKGLPIYTQPSLEFIPFIYTPGYFYFSELAANIFGIGYFPLRLVSFLASMIFLFFIYLIVKKETGSKQLGLISAGLFAACYEISGFWFDLARVDSLFLAFFIVAVFLLRFYNGNLSLLTAGILTALSFLTKQSALIFIIPLILYIVYSRKWKSIFFILPLIIISGCICYYINLESEGWFNYWLFELPAGHQWIYQKLISFWISDILNPLAFAFLISLMFFFIKIFNKTFKKSAFYLVFAIGMFGCSWLSRIHLGGYDNVLMPAFLSISILFGLGIKEFQKIFAKFNFEGNQFLKLFILISISAQFFTLFYNPLLQIPNKNDYEYGRQLVEEIKKNDGEVYIPDHPYIARYAGKKSFSHYYVFQDYLASNSHIKENLWLEYMNALKNKEFSVIILDSYTGYEEIEKHYKFERVIFPRDNYLKCRTGGHKTRPEYVYVPK
ncbi:ArnT family glycosyltransferase [Bacteroidota bacterium]